MKMILYILAANIILLIFYKGYTFRAKALIATIGVFIFIHELLHFIPSLIFGANPRFVWRETDRNLACVYHGIRVDSPRYHFWIITRSTFLVPIGVAYYIFGHYSVDHWLITTYYCLVFVLTLEASRNDCI